MCGGWVVDVGSVYVLDLLVDGESECGSTFVLCTRIPIVKIVCSDVLG
jgi:hypothetical protein